VRPRLSKPLRVEIHEKNRESLYLTLCFFHEDPAGPGLKEPSRRRADFAPRRVGVGCGSRHGIRDLKSARTIADRGHASRSPSGPSWPGTNRELGSEHGPAWPLTPVLLQCSCSHRPDKLLAASVPVVKRAILIEHDIQTGIPFGIRSYGLRNPPRLGASCPRERPRGTTPVPPDGAVAAMRPSKTSARGSDHSGTSGATDPGSLKSPKGGLSPSLKGGLVPKGDYPHSQNCRSEWSAP
jgi:hypothetical protein